MTQLSKTRQIITVMFVIIVFIGFDMSIACTKPNFGTIVVTFGNSNAVEDTLANLKTHYPNIAVVSYNERNQLKNQLLLMNNYGELIVIGHGNNNGIQTNNGNLRWKELSKWINRLPASEVIVLACYSSEIAKYIHTKPLITMPGVVDGIIASSFVASKLLLRRGFITEARTSIMDAMIRINYLQQGLATFVPLTYVIRDPFGGPYGMGWVEIFWDFGNLAMLIASVILTFSGPWIIPKIGKTITSARLALFNILANFVAVLINHMSVVAMVGSALIAVLGELSVFLIEKVIPKLSLFQQAAAVADVTAQVAATTASGGSTLAIKALQIIAIVASFTWWLLGVGSDLQDKDDVSNMPQWIFGG